MQERQLCPLTIGFVNIDKVALRLRHARLLKNNVIHAFGAI